MGMGPCRFRELLGGREEAVVQRRVMSLRLLLVALAGAAVVAACASDDDALTVAEYAERCGARSGFDEVWETWGEFTTELSDVYNELAAATPPDVLIAFHAASTEAARVLLAFGEDQPADAVFDTVALSTPALLAAADALDAARSLLPEDVRSELRATGCIGEEG